MNVFVKPMGLHSRAMVRVENALMRYAPKEVTIVNSKERADWTVLHVIGPVHEKDVTKDTIIIQYCYKSAGLSRGEWLKRWRDARMVWSYYDLPHQDEFNFYFAPLGVDDIFTSVDGDASMKDVGVLTTGYVSGPQAEAIEDVARAAMISGFTTLHVGPNEVVGMNKKGLSGWFAVQNVSDRHLGQLYARARWVSALRYVEGFELPALEALMCGTRPIVFDRKDMLHWYNGHAMHVPECSGQDLIVELVDIFTNKVPNPVDSEERALLMRKFNWEMIATRFWEKALGS